MDEDRRANLVAWRKEVVAARENWLAVVKMCNYKDDNDRKLMKFCKEEAADCLKHERACTQMIETIDGKRPAPGELTGGMDGFLSYKTPKELDGAYLFCRGIADFGLSEKERPNT